MSYLVEQKVGDKIYVYEASSYWDSEKKQSRQKRVFLGRKDPETGEIIPTKYAAKPSRPSNKTSSSVASSETPSERPSAAVDKPASIKSVRETGATYVAKELMAQTGLKQCVQRVYGERSEAILSLVQYMLLESGPYYLQSAWADRTGELALSSQSISDLLADLGELSGLQDAFFREWNTLLGHQKAAYFDITSLSSYSQNIDFLEWGYNRDGESLEQLNLGVVIGETSGLPMMYRIYPGSISDVATLQKTLQIGREQYGLDTDQLIMDRGFYSQHNLSEMVQKGFKFVIPVPSSVMVARQLLSESKLAIQSPVEAFSYEGDAYFYHRTTFTVKDLTFEAHIYLNDARRAKEMKTFLRRLGDLESALSEQTFYSVAAAEELLESHMRFSSGLFELSYTEDNTVLAKRKRNVLSRWMNRFGKMILITNDPSLSKRDILHHYRQKDCVEKYYDTLKNTLNQSRLRVHSQSTAQGHLFLTFLTSIVYIALSSRMKHADLFKSLTIPELFAHLKNLRSISLQNGNTISTEIPKKLRSFLQKLAIPLPD